MVVAGVFLAMTLIVGGDTAGKLLAQAGISPGFVAWSRFALAALILVPLSSMRREEWRLLADWRIILRSALIAGGILCILTALRTEQMANAFGAFFVGPVVAYVASALLLKERVTLARSVLLAVGFLGVLLVVRPSGSAGPGIWWAVLAGCLHGSYLAATRWLAVSHRPRFLLASQLMIGAVILLPAGIAAVPELDLPGWALVLASALGSAFGNLILVVINRQVPASVTAPLIYFQLVAATAYGLVVFDEWPDQITLAGLVVIIASGVAGFVLSRRPVRPSPARP